MLGSPCHGCPASFGPESLETGTNGPELGPDQHQTANHHLTAANHQLPTTGRPLFLGPHPLAHRFPPSLLSPQVRMGLLLFSFVSAGPLFVFPLQQVLREKGSRLVLVSWSAAHDLYAMKVVARSQVTTKIMKYVLKTAFC